MTQHPLWTTRRRTHAQAWSVAEVLRCWLRLQAGSAGHIEEAASQTR